MYVTRCLDINLKRCLDINLKRCRLNTDSKEGFQMLILVLDLEIVARLTFQIVGTLTLVFGPTDIANLWNLFNRIRTIIGEFGSTQIRTSSFCSSDRKKDVICFLGSEDFAQRFNRPFDENYQKTFLGRFLKTQVTILADFCEYGWAYGGIFSIKHDLARSATRVTKLWEKAAEKIIKIWPTVAELSVKNLFPIINANP